MFTLVLGGTKTGKTSFASQNAKEAALQRGKPVLYIATATHTDDEMTQRIQRHKKDRPEDWLTWEEPQDIASRLQEKSKKAGAVVIDCFTLLLNNWIFAMGEKTERDQVEEQISDNLNLMINALSQQKISTFLISNQVELGLHSPYKLGRLFQDLAGLCHQKLAGAAEEVFVLYAGIPQKIK